MAAMNNAPIKKQRGATLLISLILLLVLTILALAAGRSATLQQRMAGNQQQQNSAFQAAENGIQAAIVRLQKVENRPVQGKKKCLSAKATEATLPELIGCPATISDDDNYYYVEVEAVADCGANTQSIPCYIITSTGHVDSSTAKHQQGYMF